MRKVGELNICEFEESYFSDDNEHFFKDPNGEVIISGDDLNEWAIWLNSPWSQDHCEYQLEQNRKYKIKYNCVDAYTPIDEDDFEWKCEYSIQADDVDAKCIGYGNTEEEALLNCKKLFSFLQSKYNKERKSI